MPTIEIGAVVLVTGANGGLGIGTSSTTPWTAVRARSTPQPATPRTWDDDRVCAARPRRSPLPTSIAAAAERAGDLTVLVNNAGAANGSSVFGDLTAARELFETNFWGALAVADAFNAGTGARRGAPCSTCSRC